jgi:hypothetical protein
MGNGAGVPGRKNGEGEDGKAEEEDASSVPIAYLFALK